MVISGNILPMREMTSSTYLRIEEKKKQQQEVGQRPTFGSCQKQISGHHPADQLTMTDQNDEERRLHSRPTAVLYCAATPTVVDNCSITQARFCCVAVELTEEEEPECSAALWAVSWLKLPSDWPIVSATVDSTNWTPVQHGTATTHTHTHWCSHCKYTQTLLLILIITQSVIRTNEQRRTRTEG